MTTAALPGVVTPPTVAGVAPPPTTSLISPPADDLLVNQSSNAIKSQGVGRHSLTAKPGDKPGEVILSWNQAFADVDNYDVVYGTQPGKFQYGALNVGKVTSYTVKSLDPKKHYYFAIAPVKGGQAQYITPAVSDTGTAAVNTSSASSSDSSSGGLSGSTQTGQSSTTGTTTVPSQTSVSGSGSSGSTTTTTTTSSDSKKADKKDDKKSK